MINDIKMNMLSITDAPKVNHDAREVTKKAQNDSITISNHLDTMVHMMASDTPEPAESTRVQAVKNQIESGNYHVDTDALSEKLVHHLFNGI